MARRVYQDSLRSLAYLVGDFPGLDIEITSDLKWQQIPREFDFALTEERYDVLAMQRKLAATIYAIDSAKLEKFPSFKVGGFVGVSALGDFINSYQAGVNQPLYRGGEIDSKIDIQKAKYNIELARYRDLLLQVAREVEKGFVNITLIKDELKKVLSNQESPTKKHIT